MYTAWAIVPGHDFLSGGASEGLAMAMARDALAAARADFRRLAALRTGAGDEGPFMARVQADAGAAQWAGRGPWEAPGSRARRDFPQAPRRTLARR